MADFYLAVCRVAEVPLFIVVFQQKEAFDVAAFLCEPLFRF
jgi:hypothetical protein